MSASRASALSLYRRLIRAERNWTGGKEEVEYIRKERSTLFRANQALTDPSEIKEKLEEGENRLQIGLHYGIAYPRLHHAKPKIYKPAPSADPSQQATVRNDKLKAAMERRRAQLSAQPHVQSPHPGINKMKINIEIEISPDEVGLATELIATLRALTSHVSVKQVTRALLPTLTPSHMSVRPVETPEVGGNAIGGPVHHLAPGPQVPAPGAGAAPVAPSKGSVSTPAPGVMPPHAPSPMDAFRNASPDMFVPVINRLMEVPNLSPEQGQQCIESVAADIKSIFLQSPNSKEELISTFLQAFTSIVFSVELVQAQQPLLPFMEILPMLPDSAYQAVRDKLISAVLKHLTIKRPLDADRAEFFAFAEAFAALVKLGTVSISGSITTIITLLNKAENRCAAVTMLGKTCELCGDLLVEKCTDQELAQLRGAVDMIAADVNGPFQYDVNYIKEIMGWANAGS